MQDNYDQNRLITPWGYVGYSLLFSIPIVGLICVLVFPFRSYPCRKNYARSFLIIFIIAIVLAVILFATGFNYNQVLRNYVYKYY